jgi:hypothetical protein
VLAEDLGVSENDETKLGTSQGDVETAGVVQETDSLVVVGTDTRQDDVVLLTTLESVDGGNLNLLVQLLAKGSVGLHGRNNVGALSFVRGDDTDLAGLNAGLEEAGNNLLTSRSLSSKLISSCSIG